MGFDYLNNLQNNNMASSFDLLGMSNLSLQGLSSSPTDYLSGIAAPIPSPPIIYPPKAHIKRQKMIYHCKFGEFGILGGQFTEPSGVAVTPDNEIVVADTNNHRIQVFDKEGNFKFQFCEVILLLTNWFRKYIRTWTCEFSWFQRASVTVECAQAGN